MDPTRGLVVRSPEPQPEIERALEQALRDTKRSLSRAALELVVEPRADDEWALTLRGGGLPGLPDGIVARCWPATLPAKRVKPLAPGASPPSWDPVSFEALTAFLALELTAARGVARLPSRFVLRLPLVGAPADREQRLVLSLLKDRDQVLRLLWILLAHEELSVQALEDVTSPATAARTAGARAWTASCRYSSPSCAPSPRIRARSMRSSAW